MAFSSGNGLARVLSQPETTDAQGLLGAWYDQTFTLRFQGAGRRAPAYIGGHLRRSLLGALGRSASPSAQGNLACTWDPPCAYEVFGREQLRGPRGDGLPKPYVMRAWSEGADLIVALRIIGMANDWAMVCAEALVLGIRDILPWPRVIPAMDAPPEVTSRLVEICQLKPEPAPHKARLTFLSPVDATGADITEQPSSLITRMIRRVDAVSRWNGVALPDRLGAELAILAKSLEYDTDELRPGRYESPNRHRQKRRDPTLSGHLDISGNLTPLWPILRIAERCHIGRHSVEGLGAFRLT